MNIEDKHKQKERRKTSIDDSRGRGDRCREKKRIGETWQKEKRERIWRRKENKEMSLMSLYIDIKLRSVR